MQTVDTETSKLNEVKNEFAKSKSNFSDIMMEAHAVRDEILETRITGTTNNAVTPEPVSSSHFVTADLAMPTTKYLTLC